MGARGFGRAVAVAVGLAVAGLGARAAEAQVAARPDFFPAPAGSSWTYGYSDAMGQNQEVTSLVLASARFGNYEFSRIARFGAIRGTHTFLSNKASGVVAELIPGQAARLCYLMANGSRWTFKGVGFGTGWDGAAAAVAGVEDVRTPAGVFPGCLRVEVQPPFPSEHSTQWFSPRVGLVREVGKRKNVQYTIALKRYRVGALAGPRLAAQLVLAQTQYVTPGILNPNGPGPMFRFDAVLTVRSATGRPETVRFRSTQRYDVVIEDENGQVRYVWSANIRFAGIPGSETYTPQGTRYAIQFEIPAFGTLGFGKRQVKAFLTAVEEQPEGQVQIEVIPGP